MSWMDLARALNPRHLVLIGLVSERLGDGRSVVTLLDGATVPVVGDEFPVGTRVEVRASKIWRKLPVGEAYDLAV